MRQGMSPELACRRTIERIVRKDSERAKELQVGFIAMNKAGKFGGYALQKGFTYAVQSTQGVKVYNAKSLFS
jgi:N4-(beta-N-acetylglucosaminyl)-L-asparaginase